MLGLVEEKNTYLGIAAKKNYIDVAKWLLKNGADPNIYPRPLILSIKNGHLSMVRLLAKNGADVNGVGGGPCPLELAMGIKETQLKQGMVELLEGYGAKYYASSSRHCWLLAKDTNNFFDLAESLVENAVKCYIENGGSDEDFDSYK